MSVPLLSLPVVQFGSRELSAREDTVTCCPCAAREEASASPLPLAGAARIQLLHLVLPITWHFLCFLKYSVSLLSFTA